MEEFCQKWECRNLCIFTFCMQSTQPCCMQQQEIIHGYKTISQTYFEVTGMISSQAVYIAWNLQSPNVLTVKRSKSEFSEDPIFGTRLWNILWHSSVALSIKISYQMRNSRIPSCRNCNTQSLQCWDDLTGYYQYSNVLSLRWPFCVQGTEWSVTTVPGGQLITTAGRRRLRSSNVATCDVPRSTNPHNSGRRSMLHCCWSTWVCGTIYHFISVTFNYHFLSFASYWKRICLAELGPWRHLVNYCRYSALYQCTYLLTHLLCRITWVSCYRNWLS